MTATTTGVQLEVLSGCGHLPPAEDPIAIARMVTASTEERVLG